MGKVWDGGDVAFRPETWAAVYRVLKPGAHLIAMGGTRTYHRLACAIEDAGFEIRDTVSWLYGCGFPKSHDVSKGIDRNIAAGRISWFGEWLRKERAERGISQKELAERGGFFDKINHGGLVANWELGYGIPTVAEFNRVCDILELPFERIEEVEREIIGQRKVNRGVAFTSDGPDSLDVTLPTSDAARQWEGWGTALKPACELIVLARKPLSEGTVAANVLRWGTGAINVDGCRVGTDVIETCNSPGVDKFANMYGGNLIPKTGNTSHIGRWPANVVHDGSDEVVAAFPESESTRSIVTSKPGDVYGGGNGLPSHTGEYGFNDSGSVARYFYTAKADADDRLGSKHPTVKPLDLMQWLVRLVTPPRGTVLDPFAGTGTTGEAAWREGMRAVLIEAESEYQADIRRRMALALAGPDERARESIKARNLPRDDGPLFAGRDPSTRAQDWAEMWAKPFDFSQEPRE
jgi:site-specific DNA-methyltransferase (adenine-specific)